MGTPIIFSLTSPRRYMPFSCHCTTSTHLTIAPIVQHLASPSPSYCPLAPRDVPGAFSSTLAAIVSLLPDLSPPALYAFAASFPVAPFSTPSHLSPDSLCSKSQINTRQTKP